MKQKDIKEIINERNKTHGGIRLVGETSQRIKEAIRLADGYGYLPKPVRECLDMIAHKVARLCEGN